MSAELQEVVPIDSPPPEPRKYRLASVTAPRPGTWGGEGIGPDGRLLPGYFLDPTSKQPCRVNPLGHIEPPHVGAFFFDLQNKVFYRADGPTAYDWGLVTPAEMPDCLVQSFVDFMAPAHNAMSHAELLEALKDEIPKDERPPHILDSRRMGEAGLRVNDQRHWTAPGGVRVMMCRITLEAPPPVAFFVGFCSEPVIPMQPPFVAVGDQVSYYDKGAIGVGYDDHPAQLFCCVAGDRSREHLVPGPARFKHLAVRIEMTPDDAMIYVNDSLQVDASGAGPFRPEALAPRVSFFRYGRPA